MIALQSPTTCAKNESDEASPARLNPVLDITQTPGVQAMPNATFIGESAEKHHHDSAKSKRRWSMQIRRYTPDIVYARAALNAVGKDLAVVDLVRGGE